MKANLFEGELVRLTAEDPHVSAEATSRWIRNSVYMRFLDASPSSMWSVKKLRDWREKELDKKEEHGFEFYIRTREEERLIGFIELFVPRWQHGDGWIGIGIGEPDFWGNGYGTDAMRIILRYAFQELNLHRVTLSVFEYNQRAIRSYEKAGFKIEGIERQAVHRDGNRADVYVMGVLREEWERQI